MILSPQDLNWLSCCVLLLLSWKRELSDKTKSNFFQAAGVSMLLYGCTTWTLTKRIVKKLNGNRIRMLRTMLNNSRKQHPPKQQLYGHLPPILKTIQIRRRRHMVYCRRIKDELQLRRRRVGRPGRTYLHQLSTDIGCCLEDLPEVMDDIDGWRERERERERELGKSMWTAWHDDDDILLSKRFNLTY